MVSRKQAQHRIFLVGPWCDAAALNPGKEAIVDLVGTDGSGILTKAWYEVSKRHLFLWQYRR